MISAIVLTYNEEKILQKCLNGLSFVDEIIVYDSFSTDNTVKIATAQNARVIQRKFDDYASQRNAALAAVNKQCQWILMVDADEIVTPELRNEITQVIKNPGNATMYRVRRKDIFRNKWIKHASGYPTWFPRLFKNNCVEVTREINEEYETTGEERFLKGHLIHYPFNKGISWWFSKHNIYSQMEAKKILVEKKEPILLKDFLSKNPVIRRKAQKRLSYRTPMRPLAIFIALYFFKGGILDGKAGLTFCTLRMTYEWMISLKIKELSLNQ